MKQRAKIGFWNVRTLWGPHRLLEAEQNLLDYNLLLLGMTETRLPGIGEIQTTKRSTLLYSGKIGESVNREAGVAFLLSEEARKSLINWIAVSERIALARFNADFKTTVALCYAPTETSSYENKNKFYNLLNQTITGVNPEDVLIVIGDLNAKIGSYDDEAFQYCMGKYGFGERNSNGDMFLRFCLNNKLIVGWSLFAHRSYHSYTWTSPNGKVRNQIDHIAITARRRFLLTDVRNKRGADIDSDHELVVATLKLKLKSYHHNSFNSLEQLESLCSTDLKNKFAGLRFRNEENDFIEMNKQLSEKTWELIRIRRYLKIQLLSTSLQRNKTVLSEKYRKIRILIYKSIK